MLTPARRPSLIAALLLTTAFPALWLSLPDKTYVLDGVMFSSIIERAAAEWRSELFNPRHFLFNPAFQLLRDRLGASVGAYRLIQIVNALAGALGLWMFRDLLRRFVDDALAVGFAALLAASWAYGTRATEGQTYMLLAVGGLWTLRACARLFEAPTLSRAFGLASVFSLAVLFHAAALGLAPAVGAAFWLAFPRRPGLLTACALFSASLILVPYALAFGSGGLSAFVGSALEHHGALSGLGATLWGRGGVSLPLRVLAAWTEAGRALIALPEHAAAPVGLVLWLTAAGALSGAWSALDLKRRALVEVLVLAWAGCVLLNALWFGGLFFAPLPSACLLAVLAAASGPRLSSPSLRRRAPLVLGVLAALLGLWNLREGLLPQSLLANNASYDRAMFLKSHTVPSSYVVVDGLTDSNLKAYLPVFGNRPRESLDYYFLAHPKAEALSAIHSFVSRRAEHGVPLYVLGAIVDDEFVRADLQRLWSATPEEVMSAFGPGQVIGIARRADVSVYLFVPNDMKPELFAGLGYSVLTENEPQRLSESVFALTEIARGMSRAERKRAGELLRDTDGGFQLLREGFAGQIDSSSDAVRAARFGEYRKTAAFRLRVGNLYKILAKAPR